jgi:hypothetical protein
MGSDAQFAPEPTRSRMPVGKRRRRSVQRADRRLTWGLLRAVRRFFQI